MNFDFLEGKIKINKYIKNIEASVAVVVVVAAAAHANI